MSQDEFVDFMADALPRLMGALLREDGGAVAKGQLSVPQFWAMQQLHEHDMLTLNQLAEQLNRSKSTASGLIDRLEKRGMVKRSRCTHDRRIVHLSLTKKGTLMMKKANDFRKNGIRKTYGALAREERAQYSALVSKILKTLSVFLLAPSLLLSSAHAEERPSYTLQQAIEMGLERSVSVMNADRTRQIADEQKRRALAGALPNISVGANHTLANKENLLNQDGTTSISAEAAWQIYSGGRVLSAIRAARAYDKLTMEQERRIRALHANAISLAYYGVKLAEAQVKVRALSVEQLTLLEKETKEKYEAGTIAEFDWLRARVDLANEKPQLIAAQNKLSLAREEFRNLTYLDVDDFTLSDPLEYKPLELPLDLALSVGLQKRPELFEQESTIELRYQDIKQKKSEYLPKIDLFASVNASDPDPYRGFGGAQRDPWGEYWTAGIRARWTLFDGGLRKADLAEAKLNRLIEQDNFTDLKRSVKQDIRSQWLRCRDSAEAIAATEESIALAERSLEIAKSRYDSGLGTYLEFTQANLDLSDARLVRLSALSEYMKATTGLKYATGTLLKETNE